MVSMLFKTGIKVHSRRRDENIHIVHTAIRALVLLCLLLVSGSDAWGLGNTGVVRLRKVRMSMSVSQEEATVKESVGNKVWANSALLISSFSDGVCSSPDALEFLKHGLVSALFKERIRQTESEITDSVKFSPCSGPDIGLLEQLEHLDQVQEEIKSPMQQALWKAIQEDNKDLSLRILYIPTAMYALRSDSTNTPGKQRQRARADGKKRRQQLVQTIQDMFIQEKLKIQAVTLDLDDASIKQTFGSDDPSIFPKNGKDAFSQWKPHLIYVEGGNTFWLHHCVEKGDWAADIKEACTGTDAYAFYCGKSAGAILAGASVETATWKGWDDPSVVPGKESYQDWTASPGLNIVGGANLFPHMSSDWDDLIQDKKASLSSSGSELFCLQEWDACCVNGQGKTARIISNPPNIENN